MGLLQVVNSHPELVSHEPGYHAEQAHYLQRLLAPAGVVGFIACRAVNGFKPLDDSILVLAPKACIGLDLGNDLSGLFV